MKRQMKVMKNCILAVGFCVGIGMGCADTMSVVRATSAATSAAISDVKEQIKGTQEKIEGINENIDALSDKQDLAEEIIADLNAEIINTMTSIGLKEDEIAKKEEDIVEKQAEIEVTQQEYEAAKEKEEQQYAAMVIRIQSMYEKSSANVMSQFLTGEGLSAILNRMDFIERVYAYDRNMLEEYEETKEQVHALWEQLELEKYQLETDKADLEADKVNLEEQKASLDVMLAKKKQESANYEAEIKRAKKDADKAKKLLQKEQKELQQLQARALAEAQQNLNKNNPSAGNNSGENSTAANGNYAETGYTDMIDNANGSELGRKIAKYACQYIGNPYVYGGTSLTNGADCSGFVFRVYKDFGYSLPRTSFEQRSAGKGVSYSEAQPGDIVCYDGHVGIYIGNGKIVHASTERTGIKISNANYREILSVRRII